MKLTSLTSVTLAEAPREEPLELAGGGEAGEAAAQDEDVPGHGGEPTRAARPSAAVAREQTGD